MSGVSRHCAAREGQHLNHLVAANESRLAIGMVNREANRKPGLADLVGRMAGARRQHAQYTLTFRAPSSDISIRR